MWTCDERNTYMESSSSDSYGFSLSNEPSKQVFLFFSFHWFVSISNSKVNSIWYCSYFSTLESSLEESSLELKDHKYSLYKTQMQNTIKIFTSFKICPSRKIYRNLALLSCKDSFHLCNVLPHWFTYLQQNMVSSFI